MPYWAATDLAGFFPQAQSNFPLITASSYPVDLTRLATYIFLVSARFDAAAVQSGYDVPIATWVEGYGYVQDVVRMGVIGEVMQQIYVGPDDEGKRWMTMFDTAVNAIKTGNARIPGAPADPNNTDRLLPIWNQNPPPLFRTCQSPEYTSARTPTYWGY